MYVRKQFMKQFFGLRYAHFLFHVNFISYHWLQLISVQTDSFRVRSDSIWMYVRIVFGRSLRWRLPTLTTAIRQQQTRPLRLPVEGFYLKPLVSVGGYRRRRPKILSNICPYAPPTTILLVWYLILRRFIRNIPLKLSFWNAPISAWNQVSNH